MIEIRIDGGAMTLSPSNKEPGKCILGWELREGRAVGTVDAEELYRAVLALRAVLAATKRQGERPAREERRGKIVAIS